MNGVGHFAAGSIFGLIVHFFLARDHRFKAMAPFAIILCGFWAALPHIMSLIFDLPRKALSYWLNYLFFFYPLFDKIQVPIFSEIIPFLILWLIYVYICYYYISYIKKLARKIDIHSKGCHHAK